MKYEFTWEIKSINKDLNIFQVECTRLDTNKKYLFNLVMPVDNSLALQTYIEKNIPYRVWDIETQPVMDESNIGLTGNNTVFATLDIAKQAKRNDIARLRYNKEIGGIELNNSRISTTRESQSLINSAYTSLANNILSEVDFKTITGVFVKLTLTEMTAIATAVATHVQACFTQEKTLNEQVDLATTVEELNLVIFQ